jgi:hypothetical protein
VTRAPVSDDIAAVVARFYRAGNGSTHTKISAAVKRAGYADVDPFDPVVRTPNKEERVLHVLMAAVRSPSNGRKLVDGLLRDLRADGFFDDGSIASDLLERADNAFGAQGWKLSPTGVLTQTGPIDLSTGQRPALDEQLYRLQQASDDPALALGSAKDLLEAVAKFVLAELDWPLSETATFSERWHFARERLGILPQQVAAGTSGGNSVKAILQSAWNIAEQVNALRNDQGTGHGRILPTGVTAEVAWLVVREACSVAEFVLATLDRVRPHDYR